MTPKQRVAVFVKAQATRQLKNKQALSTYLADWPQIKEANRNNPRIFWIDPEKRIETQEDLDQAIAECRLFEEHKAILSEFAGYSTYDL